MCSDALRYHTVLVRNNTPERRERRRERQLFAVEARIEERAHAYYHIECNSEERTMRDRSSQRLASEYRNVCAKMNTHASRANLVSLN